MAFFLVGVGGIFGSVARYFLGRFISERTNTIIPLGTFLINITGSFLLGVVYALGLNSHYQRLFADGFLGAYTTFSTFTYESMTLFQEGKIWHALVYIIFSLITGILGFMIGLKLIGIFVG